MSALHRKLLRDLVRLWPQALAIALVMAAGAATLVLGVGAYQSLSETRAAYYERNRFADVFANLTRAPKVFEDEIARIPGVAAVETRIAKIALLDLPDTAEPASAMFVSIPDYREQKLNLLHLRSGRLPLPGDEHEVVVSEPFAKATSFRIGSTFQAILNGRKRTLRIVGTGLSPEFIYTLGPGGLMPDDRRYGIVWMRREGAGRRLRSHRRLLQRHAQTHARRFRSGGDRTARCAAHALRRARRLRPARPDLARFPRCRAASSCRR